MLKAVLASFAGFALLAPPAFAHDPTPGTIEIGKAAELAVHRIERLVTLKKIDPIYQSDLARVHAERTAENGATYKVKCSLSPDFTGRSSGVTLYMDQTGKILSFSVDQTRAPETPLKWPADDALTLTEKALHFVMEGWQQHPEVKAFFTGLMDVELSPLHDAAGALNGAQVTVTSDDDPRTLHIKLALDGVFQSFEIK